jgi:hypothetical protein
MLNLKRIATLATLTLTMMGATTYSASASLISPAEPAQPGAQCRTALANSLTLCGAQYAVCMANPFCLYYTCDCWGTVADPCNDAAIEQCGECYQNLPAPQPPYNTVCGK